MVPLFLLGYPDSNQERQDQNLQCYHYTIAQTNSITMKEKTLSLLGYPDSNQERQDQNLQCYHYTIAQLRLQIYSFFVN